LAITHWIQSADFSSKELGVADQAEALRLLRDHPWSSELAALRGLEERGEECCPPGLGLVAEEGKILHFCPVRESEWEVHHHYREARKILGIIPSSRDKSETFSGVSMPQAEQLVVQFFSIGSVSLAAIV